MGIEPRELNLRISVAQDGRAQLKVVRGTGDVDQMLAVAVIRVARAIRLHDKVLEGPIGRVLHQEALDVSSAVSYPSNRYRSPCSGTDGDAVSGVSVLVDQTDLLARHCVSSRRQCDGITSNGVVQRSLELRGSRDVDDAAMNEEAK